MKIEEDELKALQTAKSEAQLLDAKSQIANAEAKAAMLNYENTLLKIYLKYNLNPKDSINELNGAINIYKEENNESSTTSEVNKRNE